MITEIRINGIKHVLRDTPDKKSVRSAAYNYDFDKKTGFFARWGATLEDDPTFAPTGPEIWDCECTTICAGMKNQGIASPCRFCYKSNNSHGVNLSFRDFKTMLDKMPHLAEEVICIELDGRIRRSCFPVTQIAFGADSRAESNPELFEMMRYCRESGIVPNITVSDVSDVTIKKLCKVCGAVAVSRYEHKGICYDIVRKLREGGISQPNIHALLSAETFDWCMETAKDAAKGKIPGLNALVFLSLKKKGRAKNGFNGVSYEQFKTLFLWCLENKVPVGYDSCSAPRFLKLVTSEQSIDDELRKRYVECCEPCESGIFSFYTGVDGCYYACSFAEGEAGWEKGLSLLECDDFYKDIWYHPKNVQWRKKLIHSGIEDNCRKCLTFPEIN